MKRLVAYTIFGAAIHRRQKTRIEFVAIGRKPSSMAGERSGKRFLKDVFG
tara:strand:- start:6570 stop:6719 length:150 start_codon:yes stop_codon:yes gene_type:complete